MGQNTARILAVMIVGIFAAGCVGEADAAAKSPQKAAPPPDENSGNVRGTITDDSFQPIAGAMVALLAAPNVQTTSDAAGGYVLGGVPPGRQVVAVQALGYDAVSKPIDVTAGEVVEANFLLNAIPVGGEARTLTLIGDGYFACGADTPVVTWGNLHACVWDDHKPRFAFKAAKPDIKGILLEVAWQQSTGLTSKTLQVYLSYNQVCDPFCEADEAWGHATSTSPVRTYIDMEKETKKVKEDPMPLESITFPDRGSDPVVVVFQQRMTHYVTMFWGDHCVAGSEGDDCPADVFTQVPDS